MTDPEIDTQSDKNSFARKVVDICSGLSEENVPHAKAHKSIKALLFVALVDYMIDSMNIKTLLGSILVLLLFIASAYSQSIKNAVPDVARPLPLSSVRVTGDPLKRAQDLNADYLLKLEPDRMMAYYRKRAGLDRQKFVNERDAFTIPLRRSPITIELSHKKAQKSQEDKTLNASYQK